MRPVSGRQEPTTTTPCNEDSEACVLGAMMIDSRAADIAIEELRSEDFHLPRHRLLFNELCEMIRSGSGLDELLVVAHLKNKGKLNAAGGKEAIGQIMMATPTAATICDHCHELRGKTEERILWDLSHILRHSTQVTVAKEGLLGRIQDALDKIHQRRANLSADPVDMHDLAIPIAKETLSCPSRPHWGLQCGVAQGAIDELTGGFSRGHYVVMAGRTSMGKSTFAIQVARGVRQHNPTEGVPLLVTTEMSQHAIARQSLASAAGIHTRGILTRDLSDLQKQAVQNVIDRRTMAGVHVAYLPGGSTDQLRVVAKRHERKHGLPMLIVDLAGRLNARGESEREKLSNISGALVALKGELNCCVVACVQLNRSIFMEKDKRPGLQHLKGTGSWEEDADKVLFLHRPAYFGERDARTEVFQAKDRDLGEVRSTWINYRSHTGEFVRSKTGHEGKQDHPEPVCDDGGRNDTWWDK